MYAHICLPFYMFHNQAKIRKKMTSTLVLNAFLPFQHRLLCILLSLEDNFMYIISFSRKVCQFSSLDRTFCSVLHTFSLIHFLRLALSPEHLLLMCTMRTKLIYKCSMVILSDWRYLFAQTWDQSKYDKKNATLFSRTKGMLQQESRH